MSTRRKRRAVSPELLTPKVEIQETQVQRYIQYTAKAAKTGKIKKILMIFPDGVQEARLLEQVIKQLSKDPDIALYTEPYMIDESAMDEGCDNVNGVDGERMKMTSYSGLINQNAFDSGYQEARILGLGVEE